MLNRGTLIFSEDDSANKWRVIKMLGKGTCCEVYEVEMAEPPHSKAALKYYKEGIQYERAHDAEAMLLNLVNRANGPCKYLVKTIGDLDYEYHCCLIQEILYLDLRQILVKCMGRGASPYLVQKLTRDMLSGLHHLHKSGFVHADMKPSNLLWSPPDYCLKIIDYSLSFHVQDKNLGLIQSPGYRAPESKQFNTQCHLVAGKSLTNDMSSTVDKSKPEQQGSKDISNPEQQGSKGKSNPEQQGSKDISNPEQQGSKDKSNPEQQGSKDISNPEQQGSKDNLPHSSDHGVSMESESGEVKTTDAKLNDNDSVIKTPLTTGADKQVPGHSVDVVRPLSLTSSGASPVSSKLVDIWSVGCIVLGIFNGSKIFTAASLTKIQELQQMGMELSDCIVKHIINPIVEQPNKNWDSLHLSQLQDFVTRCLCVDPKQRWTAAQALEHDFFKVSVSPTFEDLCILPSSVLRLLNVVEDGDITEESKYQELCHDIRGECEKHGHIMNCVIPRTGDGCGKVYIEYSDWQVAQKAYSKLSHKLYNEHTVIVTYFPADDFKAKTFY